jgi:hypothetical protein
MKTKLHTLGILLLLCLLTFSARAMVVFQDNFNYSSGEIYKVSGGPTNAAWNIGYGNTAGTNIQAVGGNSVQVTDLKSDSAWAYFTNGLVSASLFNYGSGGVIYITNSSAYYFASNSPVAALYTSFTLTVPNGSALESAYFAVFSDTNFDYRCRLFVVTNTAAPYNVTPGDYRIGVAGYSSPSTATNVVQQDLMPGSTYTVVARYVLSTGLSTVWVSPTSETNTSPTITATGTGTINLGGSPSAGGLGNSTCAFVLRSTTGGLNVQLGSLIVGTLFADVIPSSAGSNPPFIVTQPQSNTNLFAGNNFTNTVFAGGDVPLSYQWYFTSNSVTTAISTATNATLPLTNLATNQSGYYSVIVTNVAGAITSSVVNVLVSAAPVAPMFLSPASAYSVTNNIGDTVNLTVSASGIPPPAYNWFVITNGVTNAVVGSNVTGTNSSTLTITSVLTNQSGIYFATATNLVGKTNSPLITLVLQPIPFVSIATLRSMVDPTTYANTNGTSLFTFQGIVTTWTNMTSSGSPKFYMQDNTAGIVVFWSGTGGSNTPPAGALVQVTAPFEYPIFQGLLTMEPVYTNPLESVTIISTNNPLPTPQPLPFDPNIQNNTAVMQSLVSSYFVASNVFLNLSSPTFVSADEPITNIAYNVLSDTNAIYNYTFTNQAGQTFIIYANPYTDIPGQTKPTGPVTIYGVLGQYAANAPYVGGYEFTPSRYADIISYTHYTNVLANLTRPGDLPTNTFAESVLRPTESLTTYVSVGDPEGGTVTLTTVTDGLPSSAYWDSVTNGSTATAVFHFQPTSADAGSNYVVTLAASSTSGTVSTNYWYVYVPTPLEQQIYISEFLANPTANTNVPYFNPLHRATDTTNITSWDQYVEIANTSATDIDLFGWSLGDALAVRHVFFNGAPQEQLSASSAVVIYGGALNSDPSPPNLPVQNFPADNGDTPALSLAKSGTGVIVLRNPNYYNSGHGIQPGYIVDRVVYPADNLSTNGSLSRFPTVNSGFVPQGYISTNFATAGLQYDGSPWSSPTKVPAGVTNVVITIANNQAILGFTADTTLASTLWQANEITNPFTVVFGKQFTNPAATFSVTNLPAGHQFYFITTQ